ncbi:MAG: hypothetical protein KC475_10450, partial [Cyanobacteria bacterium HKST-UBA03]|nr:hypothetical protein [Cyanobacteria bacterium HKST-UBA03]
TGFRKTCTWGCGVINRPDYTCTAQGFVQPLDVVFSKISATLDAYDHFLYVPMATWLLKISHKLRVIQVGKIQVYLAYMLATLLGCLWWVRS